MLAARLYNKSGLTCCDPVLSELHSGTISLHHAKEGYDYPTIRLPHTLSKLAGLPTRIYQTLHEGALAFLVVIGSTNAASESDAEKSENAVNNSKTSAFIRRGPRVRISPSPLITGTFFDSEAEIVSDDEEEELATSEELPTSADDDEERKNSRQTNMRSTSATATSTITGVLTGSYAAVSTSQKNL
ncbi:MAG: hypothetical protein ACXVIU_11000 [Halobacteriota archaeon]